MSVSVQPIPRATSLRDLVRSRALPICALLVLAISIPLAASAPRAHLTSDESLYLAEAHNIAHGRGATYPSGEAVVHRAPLFPAVLAPAVSAAGPDAAYRVTAAVVIINALLVMLLAYRMGGALAGGIAGVAVAGSAYLTGLGATLYLDPFQCTFLLLAMLALHHAAGSPGRCVGWLAAAGALAGIAFLAKESAVQWLPLGALAWLMAPALRTHAGARGALAYTVAFVAMIAPWYAWVFATDGELFMLGDVTPLSMALLFAFALAIATTAIAVASWPAAPQPAKRRVASLAPLAALALVVSWAAFMLYGLTRYSQWGYNNDYPSNVPRYLVDVAPQAQPYLLLLLAWVWVARMAWRRDDGARLLSAAALLFLPFALFIANRNLQLRDALPLIYLSYVALGLAAAWSIRAVAATLAHRAAGPVLAGVLVALAAVFVMQQGGTLRSGTLFATDDGDARSWDSAIVQRNAAWMSANLPEGSRILSSRLYFSSLFVETGGRFEIDQMPTVRVDVDPSREGMLVPASNLFRWGETGVRPYRPGDDWLYLRQYPGKAYWIALSQQELMEYMGAREIDYVVLTGDDLSFSSLAYASYFSAHPAFRLIYHERATAADEFFVYRVDRSRLGTMPYPMTTSPSSLGALERETGLPRSLIERRLGVPVRVTDGEAGLSQREELEAVSGVFSR